MILIVDVFWQCYQRLLPWSLYQLQQAETLCLPVAQAFYTYAVLRDTASPLTAGAISHIDVDSIDHAPSGDFPWIKLGTRPDWVPHFHPPFERTTIPFDLDELVATQDRWLCGEGVLPGQDSV